MSILEGFRPMPPWVLLRVDPLPETTSGGIILIHSDVDANDAPGFGTVLAAPLFYRYLEYNDRGEGRSANKSLWTKLFPVEVSVGDRVLFRRFLRDGLPVTEESIQALSLVKQEHPNCLFCFVHADDILALVEDEDGA